MKKNMLVALVFATFFSCTDVLDEIEVNETLTHEDAVVSNAKKKNGGLFYTKQELEVWKQRTVSAQHSQDWSRIIKNSNAFLLNPEAELWSHNLKPVTIQPGGVKTSAIKPVREGYKLRDAAFRYLLTGEKTFGAKSKEILLKQIRIPSTKFGNRTYWVPNIGSQPPSFHCAEWALTLLFSYDYTRELYSDAEKAEIEKWFHNAGKFFKANVDYELDRLFVNRWANNYASSVYTQAVNGKNAVKYTHVGGHKVPVTAAWNFHNRQASQMRLAAYVGFMVNDINLIEASKKFVMECVKFWAFPDGLTTEFERGFEVSRPEAGFYYTFITVEQLLNISDLFARNGDFSLFNYKTSVGRYGTEGGEKSLWKVAQTLCKIKNGDFYDKKTKSHSIYSVSKKQQHKIDGYDSKDLYTGLPIVYAKEINLAQYNIYFNDQYIKNSYSKCLNTNGIRIAGSGPHHNDQGAWGVHPSKSLMYSHLEGVIWPYSNSQSR